MSAQQVEEQYAGAAGDTDAAAGGPTVEPLTAPETVGGVEVRRNGAVGAVVGVAAAAVGIGYLGRAAGSGSWTDWAVCALMAVVAVVCLRSLFDARTPMLVIDELGVRIRLAHHWRGLPWDAVETVTVQPRRGLLRDGRVSVHLHHEDRAVEGLDRAARRQGSLNRRLYGATLAVPLGLTTRVVGVASGQIAARVESLSEGRAEVVTLVPSHATPAVEPPLTTTPGATRDDLEDVDDLDQPVEPPPVPVRAAPDDRAVRRARWLRRSGRPLDEDAASGSTAGELAEHSTEEDPNDVPTYRTGSFPALSHRTVATTYVDPGARDRTHVDHGPADSDDAAAGDPDDAAPTAPPVALRRIGEVTSAVTSAVTGAVTDVMTKAVAPVHDRDTADGTVRSVARLGEPVAPLVIDQFRPEPAYDPVIGPELAAARTRVGLSVDELADRTRIRPHVIESIEVDDFAPCGGDFYARGHIRTLARVLGKDPVPLLERFEERYASAPVNARTVFEAELSTGMVHTMRRTSGGPNWALLVGAVLGLVLVWSLVRLLAGAGDEVLEDPPPMLAGSGGIGAGVDPQGSAVGRRAAAPPAAAAGRGATPVAATLSAVGGGTDVVVRDGRGTVVFRGDLTIGQVEHLEVSPPVTVVVGDGTVVSMSLAGRDLGPVGPAHQRTTRTYVRPAR